MAVREPDAPLYRLIGAERSYFTGKARPALRAKRVYFEEILPADGGYKEILERTGMSFIPVVFTPEGEAWQDTSDIIDALEARYPEPALYPASPVQRIASYLLELYGDEFLILPAMHYRWTAAESESDARDAFSAMSGNRSQANRFADRMSGALPMLGVSEATIPVIEAHLEELLVSMETLLAEQRFFLGGQMSLGDCGMMGPFYAHLYLDVVPGRLLRGRFAWVSNWIERMNHPNPGSFDGFLAGDALHMSMRDILGLIGRDAVPLILDSVRDFERWADERPADVQELPRMIGMHATKLRGVELERGTSPYTLWMVQRSLDAYRAFSASERAAVDAALARTGCEELFAYEPRHRLEKRSYKLRFAE